MSDAPDLLAALHASVTAVAGELNGRRANDRHTTECVTRGGALRCDGSCAMEDEPMTRKLSGPDVGRCEMDADLPPDEEFEASIELAQYRPPTASEADVLSDCRDWLKIQDRCVWHKVHGAAMSGAGEPDLDIVWRLDNGIGRAVKIELKADAEGKRYRPTRAQDKRLYEYQRAGALVGYAKSRAQLREILAHAEDPHYRYDGRPGACVPGAPTTPEDP